MELAVPTVFNLKVGREIMPAFGLKSMCVTTPLLGGSTGRENVRRAENYVGGTHVGDVSSDVDLGRTEWKYYALLTDLGPPRLPAAQQRVIG